MNKTTSPDLPIFPAFMQTRPALCEQATTLWLRLSTEQNPTKAQRILQQLIANPKMKYVWTEIYKKKQLKPDEYLHPACLTEASQAAARRAKATELRKKGGEKNTEDAKYLEFEALLMDRLPPGNRDFYSPQDDLTEQDYAAQQFLSRAYAIALHPNPVMFRELQERVDAIRGASACLRKVARDMDAMGEYVFPSYAEKIREVADDLDRDAQVVTPSLVNSPWLIRLERGNLEVKSIVLRLAECTFGLFCEILPTTIATVVNVVRAGDGDEKINRVAVRKIIGNKRGLGLSPTFGRGAYEIREQANVRRGLARATKNLGTGKVLE
jgi:hypothetical protein